MPPAAGDPAAGDRVALVLDAGGARSAYQVGALAVLLPELARRGQRPVVQIGTSAGALITAAMVGTAHLDAEEQAVRLAGVLDQATKRQVMRPLWRQAPVVAARYVSETLGLSGFRLRGLFGTTPLARTLGRSIDWTSLHRNLGDGLVEVAAVTATAVRTGQVVLFAEVPPRRTADAARRAAPPLRRHPPRRRAPDGLLRDPGALPLGARRHAEGQCRLVRRRRDPPPQRRGARVGARRRPGRRRRQREPRAAAPGRRAGPRGRRPRRRGRDPARGGDGRPAAPRPAPARRGQRARRRSRARPAPRRAPRRAGPCGVPRRAVRRRRAAAR